MNVRVNSSLATVVSYYCKICSSVIALLYFDKIQTTSINFPPSALPQHKCVGPHIVKSL